MKSSSLRIKTLSGIIIVMLILIVIISMVADSLITNNIIDIESDYATSRISQIRAVMKSDFNVLHSTLRDWSSWDETYDFINTKSPEYIKNNLESESIRNIRIDVIIYCDNNGKIVFYKSLPVVINKVSTSLIGIEKEILNQKAILKFSNIHAVNSGLMSTRYGPLMTVSQPILHNDFTGPINGSLIMGRLLQDDALDELTYKSGFNNICFIPIDVKYPEVKVNCNCIYEKNVDAVKDEIILERNSEMIVGHMPFYDIDGKRSYIVSANVDRNFYKQGRQNVLFINSVVIVFTIIVALLVIYMLDLLVINRLSGVGKSLRNIAASGKLSERLPIHSIKQQDELDVLTDDINLMLSSLEKSEEELNQNIAKRNSEKHYQQLIESLPAAIFIVQNGKFMFANNAGRKIIEIDDNVNINSLNINMISPEEYIKNAESGDCSQIFDLETTMMIDGRIKYLEEFIIPFYYNDSPAVQIIVNDITERRLIESEAENVREQLRALTFELMLAEDRERGKIAVDLHDEIGQSMIAARLMLGTIKDSKDIPESESIKIEEVRNILQDSILWARTLSIDLSPPVLRELGLEAGLQWLAQIFEKRHGLSVAVTVPLEKVELTSSIRTIAFVTSRELLYNVVKHAKAEHAIIDLQYFDDELKISVSDDGIGITDHQYDSIGQNGFGLFGIRERLKYIGGKMEIERFAEYSTRIILYIPCNINEGERNGKDTNS